jgi:hypothetical protein
MYVKLLGCTSGQVDGSPEPEDDDGCVTAIQNVHEVACAIASVAVQAAGVVPTGNSEPEAGMQMLVTGATPPLTIGAE